MLRWVKGVALGVVACVACAPAEAEQPGWWVGPYVGINGGYGLGNLDGDLAIFKKPPEETIPYATGPMPYGLDPEGPFGGIQIGINGAGGPFFAGIEFDFQGGDISDTRKTSFAPPEVYAFDYTATTSIDWFATGRARVGVVASNTLFYVTGGLAVGQVDYSAKFLITDSRGPGGYAHLSSDSTQVGYVLGAGVEHSIGRNWSVKLEYQYLNFGDQRAEGDLHFADGTRSLERVETDFSTDLHTLRLGLNYKFK